MAICAHTHLKTFIFAAIKRCDTSANRPVMLRIEAETESLTRLSVVRDYILSLSSVIQYGAGVAREAAQ